MPIQAPVDGSLLEELDSAAVADAEASSVGDDDVILDERACGRAEEDSDWLDASVGDGVWEVRLVTPLVEVETEAGETMGLEDRSGEVDEDVLVERLNDDDIELAMSSALEAWGDEDNSVVDECVTGLRVVVKADV